MHTRMHTCKAAARRHGLQSWRNVSIQAMSAYLPGAVRVHQFFERRDALDLEKYTILGLVHGFRRLHAHIKILAKKYTKRG